MEVLHLLQDLIILQLQQLIQLLVLRFMLIQLVVHQLHFGMMVQQFILKTILQISDQRLFNLHGIGVTAHQMMLLPPILTRVVQPGQDLLIRLPPVQNKTKLGMLLLH